MHARVCVQKYWSLYLRCLESLFYYILKKPFCDLWKRCIANLIRNIKSLIIFYLVITVFRMCKNNKKWLLSQPKIHFSMYNFQSLNIRNIRNYMLNNIKKIHQKGWNYRNCTCNTQLSNKITQKIPNIMWSNCGVVKSLRYIFQKLIHMRGFG